MEEEEGIGGVMVEGLWWREAAGKKVLWWCFIKIEEACMW